MKSLMWLLKVTFLSIFLTNTLTWVFNFSVINLDIKSPFIFESKNDKLKLAGVNF